MIHTYELSRSEKTPLYEQLYRVIRSDILSGALAGGEKLPSKRQLAEHLSVSKITVETAYAQLLAEGYITSRQRAGYFVEHLPETDLPAAPLAEVQAPAAVSALPQSNTASLFPFSVWARLMRAVLLEQQNALLQPTPHMGMPALQQAIADELRRLRGMQVRPDQIVIGAGAEYFYNLLIQFFGREKHYALEELGHRKIARVYQAGGVTITPVQMDD
ncbi:MAG: GntR family transcriptional regulator, partial [Oscillospiraceae bacterium]|nr:GntR family transcriptional regulator [Oscillospiraceae bacterium]